MEISSAVFQALLSEILSETAEWTNKIFCYQRKKVYKKISYTEILASIIEEYSNHDEQLLKANLFKYEELSKQNKSMRDMITLPVKEQTLSSQHSFCNMINQMIQKIVLLMKIYDFISESDINNKQLLTFSQLLKGGNDDSLLNFSTKII